jgi:hypothetical protein
MTPEPHDPDLVEMSPEEEAAFRRAVQEALDDPRPSIPFEKVKKWLLSWGTENELPPPE